MLESVLAFLGLGTPAAQTDGKSKSATGSFQRSQSQQQVSVDIWQDKRSQALLQHMYKAGIIQRISAVYDTSNEAVHADWVIGNNSEALHGIQHGGLSALMLDETFGVTYQCAIARSELGGRGRGIGFTANLTCDYRSPLPAGSTASVETWVEQVDGRKVHMRGRIATGTGDAATNHVDSTALFIVADKNH